MILALWGTTFVAVVFFLLPAWMVELNRAWAWPRWGSPLGRVLGAVLIAGGLGVALHCSRLFSRVGEGTPIPIEPPKHLVLSGLYRYSRNPIYVADVAILLGVFLYLGHAALLLYAVAVALVLQAVIVWWEEPVLCRRFGEAYVRYTRAVPRWLLLRPRRGEHANAT